MYENACTLDITVHYSENTEAGVPELSPMTTSSITTLYLPGY
jgi:hypothetical protein